MKLIFNSIKTAVASAAGIILSLVMNGCSLWHDDLPDCRTGIAIEFVYDYNIQRADMFNEHVGGVTVNVFDADGNFVTSKEEFNTPGDTPLAASDYRMYLDVPPGEYRIVAHALQCGYNDALHKKGAKFRTPQLHEGDNVGNLIARLDRNEEGKVENEGVTLDTLWHGATTRLVTVRDMEMSTTGISLVRNTNDLHITLRQLDDPADIDAEDFDVSVIDCNGKLQHDNSVDTADGTIVYTPLAQWTSEYHGNRSSDEDNVTERTAHMQLSLSRLIYAPDDRKPAILLINNRNTGKEIARINLPECLAGGRNLFELQNYSPQEFLDREYNYSLDFFLRGDKWIYANLSISVPGWSKRIQNVDL